MSNGITITAPEEDTFRIESEGGYLVDGGLGPDSLALGGGRVSVGPVTRGATPGVFWMHCNSEAGVYVLDVADANDGVVPLDPNMDGPHTCLEEDVPASEQLAVLRAGVATCLAFVDRFPGLDEQLRRAALRDRAAGRGDRVRWLAEGHLSSPKGTGGSVIVGAGEPVRVPTDRLADAIERITGDRPRNHVQVWTLMRRWARRQGRRSRA